MARFSMLLVFLGTVLAGCFGMTEGPGATKSFRQWAYDSCSDINNETFRHLGKDKAMYVGATNSDTSCFWAWNSPNLQAARNSALQSCAAEYGNDNCYLYADSNGLSDWVKHVSNNGGVDPGTPVPSSGGGASSGQSSCTPLPPDCQNASDRGQAALANLPATRGIYDSAGQQYCSLLILIEINEYCAMNYRAIGESYCADLADQQAQEYRSALYQAEAVLDASAASGARQVCTWQ